MTIREKIILSLLEIEDTKMLYEIAAFIILLKQNPTQFKGNREKVLELAGVLSDKDSEEIKGIVDAEFNKIEGE